MNKREKHTRPIVSQGAEIDLDRACNGFRVGGRVPIAVVGQIYGTVMVRERVEPDVHGNGIPARYTCRCTHCGAIFEAKGSDVVHRRMWLCCQPPNSRRLLKLDRSVFIRLLPILGGS